MPFNAVVKFETNPDFIGMELPGPSPGSFLLAKSLKEKKEKKRNSIGR